VKILENSKSSSLRYYFQVNMFILLVTYELHWPFPIMLEFVVVFGFYLSLSSWCVVPPSWDPSMQGSNNK
jgi:hypothetical protein